MTQNEYYGDSPMYELDEDDYEINTKIQRQCSYYILRSTDVEKLRSSIIEDFMEFTYLSKEEATLVLIYFQWNLDNLKGVWYDNIEENRKKCGLELNDEAKKKLNIMEKKNKFKIDDKFCRICEFNEIDKNAYSLKCGHKFCKECWEGYINYKMQDLLTCITSTCPQEGCNIIIPETVFCKFLENHPIIKLNYQKALFKNFTDHNSDIKWCPSPDCGLCVSVPGHSMKEIVCECKNVFCFSCGNEGHRPCDCQMIEKWIKKNNSESENVKWLIANTKQCPSCHKFIEKNQGCNHMTCRKEAGGCNYQFCWICLEEWKSHGSSYYQCNKFDKDVVQNKEEMIKNTKLELEKYVFYFDRYMNHYRAQQLGNKLKSEIHEKVKNFKDIKQIPYEELLFMDDAVETIIQCRRTLKSTYVFGYFMKNCNEKNLFEYNQNLLDKNTDKLHGMMEGDSIKNILRIDNYENFNKSFINFRNDIINLLTTINNYKQNLLSDIENKMIHLIDYKCLEK